MKKLLLGILIISITSILGQGAPQGINYQAIARDNTGSEITNASISVRFSIGTSSVSNSSFSYQETHNVSTNQFGLFNVVIGEGSPTGATFFNSIPWDTQRYLLVEVNFGSGFEQMGIATPFVSVPYALLAQDVVNKELPVATTVGQVIIWNGTNWVAQMPTDPSPSNEIQDLSVSGNNLNISGGGVGTTISSNTPSVAGQVLTWNGTDWVAQNSGSGADNWGTQSVVTDATLSGNGTSGNPLSGFDGDYNSLTNQPAIPTTTSQLTNDSGFLTSEVDGSTTNEIQNLSVSGNDLNISGGGTGTPISSTTPTANGQVLTWNGSAWTAQNPGSGADNWGTQTVVTDATLSGNGTSGNPLSGFDGDYNNLTNQPTIPSTTSQLTNDSGFLTSEVDGSTTNEIQNLSVSGNNLNISGGGTGTPISSVAPTANGQVLTWNGSAWIAQNPGSGADNWGTQTVVTDASLSGNGTSGNPLSGFDGDYNSLSNQPTIPTTTSQLTNDSGFLTSEVDGSTTNEIQNLSISGNNLNISGGGTGTPISSVAPTANGQVLTWNGTAWIAGTPAVLTDTDDQFIDVLQVNGSNLELSIDNDGMATQSVDLSSFLDNTDSQTLTLSSAGTTNTISISGGNSISFDIRDADNDPTNEHNTNFAVNGTNLEITDGAGTLSVPLTSLSVPDNDWTKASGYVYNITENIGIGTSSPIYSFEIDDNNNTYAAFIRQNNASGAGLGVYTNSTSSSALVFEANSAAAGGLIVKGDGKVGIGVTSPFGQFDVSTSVHDRASQIQNSTSSSGNKYGLYANASGGGTGDNNGGWFDAFGGATGINTGVGGQALGTGGENRGVYGSAVSGTTNWAGYFEQGNVHILNNISVGSTNHDYSGAGRKTITITDPTGTPHFEMNGYGAGTSSPAAYLDYFKSDGSTNNFIGRELYGTYGAHNTGYYQMSLAVAGSNTYHIAANNGKVGLGSIAYSSLNDVVHIYENDGSLDGENGALVVIQNGSGSYSTAATNELAGIRFKVGSYAPNGMSKAGIFFQRDATYGRGDLIFALNNTAGLGNVTTSDEILRLSVGGTQDVMASTVATTGDGLSVNNTSTAAGTGVRGIVTTSASSTGNRFGVYGAAWYGQSTNYGVYGYGYGGSTAYGIYATVGGATTNYAGYFSGNVHINGTLSKSGGTFKIDHPQDPENKYLIHSFIESPDMMNIYNGNITTDENGFATVELPEYFESLNKDFRYQLTVIGSFAQAIIYKKVSNNQFIIQTNSPNIEVSWQITGVRKDAWAENNRIIPEIEKESENKGLYLNPEAFGLPVEKGIDFKHNTSEEQ